MIEQFSGQGKQLKHRVSYSQFSNWNECPFRWYLNYPLQHRYYEPNINLLFGSSMHDTIQFYIKAMYEKGVKYADSFDLNEVLKYRMTEHFKECCTELQKHKAKKRVLLDLKIDSKDVNRMSRDIKKEYYQQVDALTPMMMFTNDEIGITQDEMVEYYADGVKILNWFKDNRADYFNYRKYKLVGIELPLEFWLTKAVRYQGFLDIVLEEIETGNIVIFDLKTSEKTWSKFQKTDKNKTMQLVMYKMFYSELFNISLDKISVQFIILKRKFVKDCEYPQKRIQRVIPASGKLTINNTNNRLKNFVENCFEEDGEYKYDGFYPKIATENNCRFCTFKDIPELCDKKN